MRFYTKQHQYYCGIDGHASAMYLCILNLDGDIVLHRNMKAGRELLLKPVAPYRKDVVIGVECIFTWYWLVDLCDRENIPFVLGHALYMKAIHGGKAKNDKIDAYKIAVFLRGEMFAQTYVYPWTMRATWDLLHRRLHLMRKRHQSGAQRLHNNTHSPTHRPSEFQKMLAFSAERPLHWQVRNEKTHRLLVT